MRRAAGVPEGLRRAGVAAMGGPAPRVCAHFVAPGIDPLVLPLRVPVTQRVKKVRGLFRGLRPK